MKDGIFVIGGFKQTERQAVGLDLTQRRLEWRYDGVDSVEVYDMRTWKADMKGLAALAKRDGVTDAIIIAYSHGGGYAAPRLVKFLRKQAIHTKLVLLCDPVYRPLWLPRWTIAQILAFRALIPRSAVIKFEEHARHIFGVRQEDNIPRAHPIQIGNQKPFEVDLIEGYKHDEIDESYEWQDLVDEKVAEYLYV